MRRTRPLGDAPRSRRYAATAAKSRLRGSNRGEATYVFHCSGSDGDWLALRGPVLLAVDLVVECAAGLMDAIPGCWEVSVWVGDACVLTLLRKCDDPLPRTAH